MALALETVVKQLTDSGIIAAGKLENFIPPKASPKDGEALLRELHKHKLLTTFQAQQVAAGKIKALVLGEYTIVDRIGAGGMGQVFKGEHRRMKRLVAIKTLPAATMKDEAAVARFQREVEAAAKLRHPNIVAADDAGYANGHHFLVMEYVDGQDLSALVKKNGPFSVATAVNYILQAAKGLEFAHKKGVVHRDIKPANLLLDNEGVVKILDMGLARISGDGNTAAQAELTGTGAVMGTVDYMAPEQGLSTKHADARADIYSLGCSLHYLLIGKPTFDGETITAKLLAHHNAPLPNLCQLRSDVPNSLQAVFAKMIAKTLEDRYQTMTEVIADLERCQAGLSSSTATVSNSSASATEESEMTMAFGSRRMQAIPAVEAYEEPESKGPPRKNAKLLIGAGAAGFLFLLLGVIVIFRNQKGEEVGRMELPDGTSVEVQATAKVDPAKAATPQPNKPWNTPAFQSWVKATQALPAEEQIEAVSKKLVELNPGFDGKIAGRGSWTSSGAPKVEDGFVTEIGLPANNLTDISPVRALVGLKGLRLSPLSGGNPSALSDLSPLKGMSLTELGCRHLAKVVDLSPLHGMPLTFLDIYGTQVSDLSPLRGMPLTNLDCYGPPISDLSPLQETRVTVLTCGGSKISDLSPLKGMPLTKLACDNTPVSDLSPLKGLPLEGLSCPGSQVSDLSPLKDCKSLKTLNVAKTKVTPAGVAAMQKALPNCKIECDDPAKAVANQPKQPWNTPAFQAWVKEVQAMPAEEQIKAVSKKLVELNPGFDGKVTGIEYDGPPKFENRAVTALSINTDDVGDVSPVRALAGLKRLRCLTPNRNSKLSDLSPLQGLRLETFSCGHNSVPDLSPLAGMPLTELVFAATKVSDLSPLRGMPLFSLNFQGSPVTDLSPVRGMQIRILNFAGLKVSDLSPVEGMPLNSLLTVEPQKITKGIEILRQMSSLETIGIDGNNKWPSAEFWKKYDAGEFGKPAASAKLAYLDPAFQQWVKATQALPAEQQVEAVSKKLVELNPGFDGKLFAPLGDTSKPKIKNGVVTELALRSKELVDLSPLRALAGLRTLRTNCGSLVDLSPLNGMSITSLVVEGCKVTDLSPLSQMALDTLGLYATKVSDLRPITGIRLTNLIVMGTAVTDLSPLRGMPIKSLNCLNTAVSDLSPLHDCQDLVSLNVRQTKVTPTQVAALQKALSNCKIEWDDPTIPKTPEPAAPTTK